MELADIEKVGRLLTERTYLNSMFWLENNIFVGKGKVVKTITVRKIINKKYGADQPTEKEAVSLGVSLDNSSNLREALKKHEELWAELGSIEITPSDVDALRSEQRNKRANFKLPEKYIKGKEKEFKKKRQDNVFVSDELDGEKETSFIRTIERQFTKNNEVEIKAKDRNEINKKDREDGLKGGF